ncbi:MAG TPA: tol-pal system-associated acyl-CoA thioesterase [Gammaproteobacteria bacterium]|nr:tol-pal system-associated acyl-CoA thioesterase [Gammaproteobacteria bacterium]HET7587645.1 tol-pal system-associated acyl-CoA thioesterase [Gammaproteobacteria bacterium]
MEFTWPVRIYYEDTDAGGVVYYANYLKFMERARTEWLRSLGIDQRELAEQRGLAFVVTEANAQYRKPARLDDALSVSVSIEAARGARIVFRQEIRRDDGALLCAGRIGVACLDLKSFRPRSVPDDIRAEIQINDG